MNFISIIILSMASIMLFSCHKNFESEEHILLPSRWKFKPGNNINYANNNFDDSNWDSLNIGEYWENQGYHNLDGYAWYRADILLPHNLKKKFKSEDSIKLVLGTIDDSDRLFINGKLVGQNNKTVNPNIIYPLSLENEVIAPDTIRKYILSVNDDRIHWGKKNTIAVQVYDQGGDGGFHTKTSPYFAKLSLEDSVIFNQSTFYKVSSSKIIDTVLTVKNLSNRNIDGHLWVISNFSESGIENFDKKFYLNLEPKSVMSISISLPISTDPTTLSLILKDKLSGKKIENKIFLPFVLVR